MGSDYKVKIDDKAYTPFFNLDAGTEYTVSYYVYMQGNDYNEDGILYLPTMRFTVGTEHDSEFHNTISKFSDRTNGWVKARTQSSPPRLRAHTASRLPSQAPSTPDMWPSTTCRFPLPTSLPA